jgi:hypothetical protein
MKNLLWLAVFLAACYFGYRWWQENVEATSLATLPSRSVESSSGGPVREWERAPDTIMEMNKATGGGQAPGKAARDAVRKNLGQTR